ncbi:S8 family serine peptidase [Actinoplanes utahensis]|uniref:Peptidase n=1 Tax=Actinoplanes utahensis TaxID=1869 RepID=A0A0A6XE11_ACTUT|nr:S8 family serine peptidase [Actinoplanes utahensis]KHD78302.1 peptidase [Actinoplanes utahensis]GIF28906.1 hypothetical protein Aut01nite_18920 [Actinoplanes utahensis]
MRNGILGSVLTAAVAASALVAPLPARAAEPPERYIVTWRHDGAFSSRAAGTGRFLRGFRDFPGFVTEMTAAQARRVAADPRVRHVERDRLVSLAGRQANPTWGLDRIDQRPVKASKSYLPSADGDTVHAYVIDTGIRVGHRQFGGRAEHGYDFVDRDANASDCNGHGTHVAGTIGGATFGVAKKVRLVGVRVLDCYGEGYVSDIIEGIDWVTENAVRPAVANMSLGGGNSPALDWAVADSIAAGITYVVAAGNENVDANRSSPADLPEAVTVAATDSRDRRAVFSNFGRGVDLFAPGVGIRSATAAGDSATAVYSGTSMAAPHVAGAAALILDAYPGHTPAQVQARLIADATKGRVTARAGSPDRLLFVPAPPQAPAIATTRTATAQVGRPYSARLALASSRRGGWKLASGSLPPGLSLSASGVISGTPTTPGSRTVTVRFTDYVPQSVIRQVVIPVTASIPVIDADLPGLLTEEDYEQQLTVADGRDGTWSLESGALPDGLTLEESGLMWGTGVTAGEFTFTVRFTDPWNQTATRTYTITVHQF